MTGRSTDIVTERAVEDAALTLYQHCRKKGITVQEHHQEHAQVVSKNEYLTGVYLSEVDTNFINVGQIANKKSETVPTIEVIYSHLSLDYPRENF